MVLNHVWGLLSHPAQEWESIRQETTSIANCYSSHVLILAAIPPICAFFGATVTGWSVGGGTPVKLTSGSALVIAIAFYVALLIGVFIVGKSIDWMGRTYGANPSLEKSISIAAYTATPLFLSGVFALFPVIWINMLVGLAALAYTIYLLYTGVPIVMQVTKEQGFLFSTAVLTVGMVALVGMLAVTVLLWGFGLSPGFTA